MIFEEYEQGSTKGGKQWLTKKVRAASPTARRTAGYFEKRGFQRYAGVWSLWALGVGAVISGHFSGWNFGFATGGWGGMLVAGIIIASCISASSSASPR